MEEKSFSVEATVKVRLCLGALDIDDAYDKAEECITDTLCDMYKADVKNVDIPYIEVRKSD